MPLKHIIKSSDHLTKSWTYHTTTQNHITKDCNLTRSRTLKKIISFLVYVSYSFQVKFINFIGQKLIQKINNKDDKNVSQSFSKPWLYRQTSVQSYKKRHKKVLVYFHLLYTSTNIKFFLSYTTNSLTQKKCSNLAV